MPRIIGITGNIACGKTAVGHILLELGAERYIDADAVVHRLYLSGQPTFCQSKWLVVCPEEQEMERLMTRNHLSEEEALSRIGAQPSVAARLALVDEIIDNGGTLEETRRQVAAAFERFIDRFPA